MTDDEKWMYEAIKASHHSLDLGLLPVGAVAVKNGALVATSWKYGKTHPHLDHAEMNMLFAECGKADRSLNNFRGCTLYVTLEPCLGCIGQLHNFRVSRIVYAVDDPHGGGVQTLNPGRLPTRHQKDYPGITKGVCETEVCKLLKQFFTETKSEYWQNPENSLRKLSLA